MLYGGAIDNCRLAGLDSHDSGAAFDMLFHIEDDNSNLSISSDPFQICPCENNQSDCTIVEYMSLTWCILVKHFKFLWLQLDKEME